MTQSDGGTTSLRIDQWLCFARIAKSRTLAQALIERGKVRLNRSRIDKTSQPVRSGDVITISLGPRVRVLQVSALGKRRGPASEAATLYVELTPAAGGTKPVIVAAENRGSDRSNPSAVASAEIPAGPVADRPRGSGRPTKRDRRAIDKFRGDG